MVFGLGLLEGPSILSEANKFFSKVFLPIDEKLLFYN